MLMCVTRVVVAVRKKKEGLLVPVSGARFFCSSQICAQPAGDQERSQIFNAFLCYHYCLSCSPGYLVSER